jgi:ADP-ribose pyrophosphatase
VPKQDLTETFVSGGEVFSGRMLKVHRDIVRLPDGKQAVREYVRHPGAVLAVPIFDDGRVLLERQYRYPLRRDFIELPAGKLEPGEPHLDTVKRELLEETGYVASEWTRLGVIHPSIGYTDESIEIFLARGLEKREVKLDDGEFLESFSVPFDEAVEMVRDGRITDGKTIAALLWVRAFGLKRG